MSQISCESVFISIPELAMVHFRGKDLVVSGKVLTISELLSKVNYVELKDYLLAVYPSKDQIFLMPSNETEDLPLSSMSLEQIEHVIFKKHSNEVRAIIAGDFKLDYDTLKASFLSTEEDDQPGILNQIRDFAHRHVIEAIASNALKRFGTYADPATKKPLLLLDNRKVFTTDKTRVKAAANRNGVLMPSSSGSLEMSPAGRIRRHIDDLPESDEEDFSLPTKKQQPDSESEREFNDYEPFVRKSSIIELSNLKSLEESSAMPIQKHSKKPAEKKEHAHFSTSPQIKKKQARKEAAPAPMMPSVKTEPTQRIPKKAPMKQESSSENSDSSSDSEASEQVFFIPPNIPPACTTSFSIHS